MTTPLVLRGSHARGAARRLVAMSLGALVAATGGTAFADDPPIAAPSHVEYAPPPIPAAVSTPADSGPRSGLLLGDARYRSPGMAAALSLTPVPVDFGNLYAENIGWGIAYTSIEVTLASGMMFVGGSHMCHAGSGCGSWSDGERYTMVGLAGAYVAVKIISAVHANNAAAEFNRAHLVMPVIAPTTGGIVVGFGAAF